MENAAVFVELGQSIAQFMKVVSIFHALISASSILVLRSDP